MAIQGLRDTSNFVADQRPKNWREGILLLYPNGSAPLTALTSLMKSKATDDPEYSWWEKVAQTRRVTLSAAITNVATTIPLNAAATGFGGGVQGGGNQLKPGDLLYAEQTGEIMRVTAVASDTSITVVRGQSGTTGTAITITTAGVNPNLFVMGSAYEEGSAAPGGVNFDPVKVRGYTQIFRNTLEATRTALRTRLRTGDAMKEAKRECLELHSIDMERAFWFGRAIETTLNGRPWRTLGGVKYFLDTYASGNVVAAGATTNVTQLETYMEQMFRHGSSEKMAFCGNTALLILQQIVRKNTNYQFMQGQKEYGMSVNRLVSPFGELVLKTHPLFTQIQGGTNGGTAYTGVDSWVFVLDMKEISYRPFDDTKYDPEMISPGVDSKKGGYLTECGLEMHFPAAHFVLTGLTAAAVG